LPAFPFGTDFTETEQRLIPALQSIKEASAQPINLLGLMLRGIFADKTRADVREGLSRLRLDKPATLPEHLYRALVSAALVRTSGS
jgi:hypothetical protein